MKNLSNSETISLLLLEFSRKEIGKMDADTRAKIAREIKEEIDCARCEDIAMSNYMH